jgi:hypothetical protein
LTPDAFGGIRTSWGLGSNEDDADSGSRASWGLQSNPPSTQVDVALQIFLSILQMHLYLYAVAFFSGIDTFLVLQS